ncbi:hypothetical protein JKG47_15835 [Acidithiobacillus sp. MC6.1]|nr:hypothetical protein [Acidithiobacillus sp. MC6.1]
MHHFELDQSLEADLLDIARKEHRTPEQILNQLLADYLSRKQAEECLVAAAGNLPMIQAFAGKDPLSLQKAMRDDWG